MKLYFFDIPNSSYEMKLDRERYEALSEDELDKSGVPLTGPFVSYEDYRALEDSIRGSKGNG